MTQQKMPPVHIQVLDKSHLFRAVRLLLDVLIEEGPLPLTGSGAFSRNVVIWSAAHFEWPYETAEDLFEAKRAPNEADFRPLALAHRLLVDLKFGVREKRKFVVTDLGLDVRCRPMDLFNTLVSHFLGKERNSVLASMTLETGIRWNWIEAIDIIENKLTPSFDRDMLSLKLFGDQFVNDRHHFHAKMEALIGILRPLFWAGFVKEVQDFEGSFVYEVFEKAELWPAILYLRETGMIR